MDRHDEPPTEQASERCVRELTDRIAGMHVHDLGLKQKSDVLRRSNRLEVGKNRLDDGRLVEDVACVTHCRKRLIRAFDVDRHAALRFRIGAYQKDIVPPGRHLFAGRLAGSPRAGMSASKPPRPLVPRNGADLDSCCHMRVPITMPVRRLWKRRPRTLCAAIMSISKTTT